MSKTCAIFDLDGTLVDSRRDLANAVNLMRNDYGLPSLSLEKITSYIGNGATKLCERALGSNEYDINEALTRFKQHYHEHMTDTTKTYPGVEIGLEALVAAGIPCAVVTNKPQSAAEKILNALNIAKNFSMIVGGGGDFPLKPEPAALLHFARINGCKPADCCMVGDHYTDLTAAANAGMKSIFAKWGFGQPGQASYDIIADSFAHAAKLILSMN